MIIFLKRFYQLLIIFLLVVMNLGWGDYNSAKYNADLAEPILFILLLPASLLFFIPYVLIFWLMGVLELGVAYLFTPGLTVIFILSYLFNARWAHPKLKQVLWKKETD